MSPGTQACPLRTAALDHDRSPRFYPGARNAGSPPPPSGRFGRKSGQQDDATTDAHVLASAPVAASPHMARGPSNVKSIQLPEMGADPTSSQGPQERETGASASGTAM